MGSSFSSFDFENTPSTVSSAVSRSFIEFLEICASRYVYIPVVLNVIWLSSRLVIFLHESVYVSSSLRLPKLTIPFENVVGTIAPVESVSVNSPSVTGCLFSPLRLAFISIS